MLLIHLQSRVFKVVALRGRQRGIRNPGSSRSSPIGVDLLTGRRYSYRSSRRQFPMIGELLRDGNN